MTITWFSKQDFDKWHILKDMARNFVGQYKFTIKVDHVGFKKLKRMTHKYFEEYVIRWRLEVSNKHPSIPEQELVQTSISLLDGIYYQK